VAVVINEFEVVPEAASPEQPNKPAAQGEGKTSPQQVEQELERFLEQQQERLERVRAH
jgi:hypothetical protein